MTLLLILLQRGWLFVSGGAKGIDSAAHKGALQAGGVRLPYLAAV